MSDAELLFRNKDYAINQHITIHQPTLNEIFDYGELKYWSLVHGLTATPSDLKWQLMRDFKLYFDEVEELEAFFYMCKRIPQADSQILLGDLDLTSLEAGYKQEDDEKILFNEKTKVIIDRAVLTIMTEYIRKMNNLIKNMEKGGNKFTRDFLIEDAKEQYETNKDKKPKSKLLPLISFVINSSESSYKYHDVWDMPIYVFLDSVAQIQTNKKVDHTLNGIYNGTVDSKKINKKELNYIREL